MSVPPLRQRLTVAALLYAVVVASIGAYGGLGMAILGGVLLPVGFWLGWTIRPDHPMTPS